MNSRQLQFAECSNFLSKSFKPAISGHFQLFKHPVPFTTILKPSSPSHHSSQSQQPHSAFPLTHFIPTTLIKTPLPPSLHTSSLNPINHQAEWENMK